jgi:hypothetical protein
MAYRKYGNRKTVVDGIKFDSRAEAGRYKELRLMEKAGVIRDLVLQPEFLLQDKFKHKGKTERAVKYTADFKYFDILRGVYIVEDVKGVETEAFKIKRKLFLKRYGGAYDFEIVKR